MAYLGNPPAEAYTNTVKDSFNGDGSTTAFTLSQPSTTNNLRVVVENVIQDPTVAYSCSGTTLTFTSAPPSGTANIYAVHLGPAVMTAVPPTEITNATTYTSALTVQGAFTSPGIDDNANATAMTIDSSENVLIGKTSTGITSAGTSIKSDGTFELRRDLGVAGSSSVGYISRGSTDGNILTFYKDTTSVGSIGAESNAAYFAGVTYGVKPYSAGIAACNNIGVFADNSADLGKSNIRFKDLYLSGGVYLGGTGAANKLDDYEEGTWTPAITTTGSSVSYSNRFGSYKKIGKMCVALFQINLSGVTSQGSGSFQIGGLPFSADINANWGRHSIQTYNVNLDGAAYQMLAYNNGSTDIRILYSYDNSTWSVASTSNFVLSSSSIVTASITYFTT